MQRTLDTTGKVVNERTVGKLVDRPTNAAGQIVKHLRDTSGAIIE